MALAAARNTPQRAQGNRSGKMAAAVTIHAGALIMRNAAGYITKGATALGSVGVGRAEESVTNSGAAGDKSVRFRDGVFQFKNSAAGDAITIAEIGDVCFVVDDETVAKTDGTGTRSPAGFIEDVDAQGVWVRFDEVLTRSYVVGVAEPAA